MALPRGAWPLYRRSMSILIVYESLFGATHEVAEEFAIAARAVTTVEVKAVEDVDPTAIPHAELIVLGAPTHHRGLSTANSRADAELIADDPFSGNHLERDATTGMREWLGQAVLPAGSVYVAFDTRIRGPRLFVGSAAHRIQAFLDDRRMIVVAPPESFLVMDNNRLEPGERGRAGEWGDRVARTLVPVGATSGTIGTTAAPLTGSERDE